MIAALRYIVGDGFALRVREYHYAGRYEMQSQWLRRSSPFPGTRVASVPARAPSDVSTMFALTSDPLGIAWIEGLNGQNTDSGSGEVPVDITMDVQGAVWEQVVRSVDNGIIDRRRDAHLGLDHRLLRRTTLKVQRSMHEGNGLLPAGASR